jgi:carbamoyl-phosphate synthase small subunit
MDKTMTKKQTRKKATLELSNGMKFEGKLIGSDVAVSGEMVFNTGMLGYSESMSDPSYVGQILVFSFCLIGNYGVPTLNGGDFFMSYGHESSSIKTQGIIASEIFDECYHHNNGVSLEEWMISQQVPGIIGVDTRYLVQTIRNSRNLFGWIIPEGCKKENTIKKFPFVENFKKEEYVDPSKFNLMPTVSTKTNCIYGTGKKKVAVVDCGVKWNILRMLVAKGCSIELVPWDSDFSKVKADGWLISNGPGDPRNTGDLVERVSDLLKDNKPVLGICLGHQIISLASGAKIKKMPYGHRSHNQPVFANPGHKAFMTSQNHSYTVDSETIMPDWDLWFENANDKGVEGIKHKTKPFMSVQFHPEASSGPNDTGWILDQFIKTL